MSSRLVNESKARLRRLIASGAIKVNGSAVSTARTLGVGDVVFLPPGLNVGPPPAQSMAIDVLYEDDVHLCVNKPSGWPVLPTRSGGGDGFYRSVIGLLNRDSPPGGPYQRPHFVHRLDRDTSGALLVAKTVDAGRALSGQFQARQVHKSYVGLIEGVLPSAELDVDIALTRQRGSVLKMATDERRGRPARTQLKVKERFGHFCLLEIRPLTGRQHQIRVHLSAIGYPLAVDHLYGRRAALTGTELNAIIGREAAPPDERLLGRCPLHAAAISYLHPSTGAPMTHQTPMPHDMAALLRLLRQADAAHAAP
ncbi:MAG: RluA family pseudouridine synthase [Planctomycetota bacterium]